MATFPTYSKQKAGTPEVFQYDSIPEKLKGQIYHIWHDFFEQEGINNKDKHDIYEHIYKILLKETGKKRLYFNGLFFDDNPANQIEKYFENLDNVDAALDTIGVIFYIVEQVQKITQQNPYSKLRYTADEAIKDLNIRFKENAVGYQYLNSKIIRIDNQLLHETAVKPALQFIHQKEYQNANEEYLNAHDHFRHRRYQECLNECLKSFETTMKIICSKNKWNFNPNDTAKPLINTLLTNKFLPNYNETYLGSLRTIMESSIPTVRNKNSGHGQGIQKRVVPEHLASYLLTITGATIKLLIETQNTLEKKPSH
jgi:hypothetical protein